MGKAKMAMSHAVGELHETQRAAAVLLEDQINTYYDPLSGADPAEISAAAIAAGIRDAQARAYNLGLLIDRIGKAVEVLERIHPYLQDVPTPPGPVAPRPFQS